MVARSVLLFGSLAKAVHLSATARNAISFAAPGSDIIDKLRLCPLHGFFDMVWLCRDYQDTSADLEIRMASFFAMCSGLVPISNCPVAFSVLSTPSSFVTLGSLILEVGDVRREG